MARNETSPTERDLIERARKVLPAGGFGNFRPDIVIARGEAGRVWDESGNEYVDFLLGSGPMLVGHRHPEVMAAVERQLAKGVTFFASNAEGIRLAEAICDAMACAEKVRFVSTGSEADMYAMRLARAHTGRDRIPFDALISVAEANTFKPHRAAYLKASDICGVRMDEVLFVASHTSTAAGPRRPGCARHSSTAGSAPSSALRTSRT